MCMTPLLMSIDSSNWKGNAERGSEKYLAEKKRLEVSSSGIWMIYLLWVYSMLVKQSSSWVLDTRLVGMKCHTEQLNIRITMV